MNTILPIAKNRRLLGLVSATAVMACLVTPVQARQTLENTGKLCRSAIDAEERRSRIPKQLLAAIASVESGRWDKATRANIAWPWTVTSEGKGKFYPTRHAAIRAVEALRRRGVSNIDVGCMQINLAYHPDAFETLHEAFEPAANVAYAAEFLTLLRKQKRGWQHAVRFYHSSDPKRQRYYSNKVYKARHEIRAHEVRQRRQQQLATAQQRRDRAAPSSKTANSGNSTKPFTIWRPRSYREQRRLENRARNWALSIKRR